MHTDPNVILVILLNRSIHAGTKHDLVVLIQPVTHVAQSQWQTNNSKV